MSEARELFERFRAEAHEVQTYFRDAGKSDSAYIFGGIVEALRRTLATQPEPAAVPELPEWARGPDRTGDYRVEMPDGPVHWYSPEYIERIGELRDILAARRRAGRAP